MTISLKEFINLHLSKSNGSVIPMPKDVWWIKRGYSDIRADIFEITSFVNTSCTWPQRLWHIRNDIYYSIVCGNANCTTCIKWSLTKSGYPLYCSKKCASTGEEKLLKFKQTCLSKFGVSAPAKSDVVRDAYKRTIQEKYGTDHYSQTDKFKKDVKATVMQRYGVDNVMNLQSSKDKVLSTNIEKYGEIHALKLDEFKDKQKSTNVIRYGDNSPSCDPFIRNKQVATLQKNYEVINYKHLSSSIGVLDDLLNKEYLLALLETNSATSIATLLDVDVTTVLNYLHRHDIHDYLKFQSRSSLELNFEKFLIVHNIKFESNVRNIISPKELDFFLPDHNIAIELCGVYWHSEIAGNKPKDYHYDKWKACRDKDITLLTYFDDELLNYKSVIESKILYLTKTLKACNIGARSVTISSVTLDIERQFLEKNHIQGFLNNRQHSYGAYFRDVLVGIFCITRRQNYVEITRFSTDTSYVVSGLFSKMLTHFIKEVSYVGKIVSFSDNCHGNGNVYDKSGFSRELELGPGYSYTLNGKPRENRQRYMKSKIHKKFNIPIIDKTEWELMVSLGYDRVWDCGKIKWELTVNKDIKNG